jgi:uncharacterized protein (UPF0147 family)
MASGFHSIRARADQMKKWLLRIALSLRVQAAPAVAQFVGSSVQGNPPSHGRVEAPWLIDGPINGKPT